MIFNSNVVSPTVAESPSYGTQLSKNDGTTARPRRFTLNGPVSGLERDLVINAGDIYWAR